MTYRALVPAALLVTLAGCTHHQLARSTVATTGTVMDIQYRIVLMNLAKLSCQPESYPSHIDLADGVVQVNDRAGFGNSGGFTALAGDFGIERYGPDGQRQITEQWGADATTDPERLTELQELYRAALGLPPLPPPNAIAYLRHRQRAKMDRQEKKEKDDSETAVSFLRPAGAVVTVGGPSKTSSGGGGSTPSGGSGSSGGNDSRQVPIEILLTDVPPPGWFHVGGKKDVPKDACFVGCCGDRYAWVLPDGVPALARFTVTVLSVVKFEPGAGEKKNRGLAVTR